MFIFVCVCLSYNTLKDIKCSFNFDIINKPTYDSLRFSIHLLICPGNSRRAYTIITPCFIAFNIRCDLICDKVETKIFRRFFAFLGHNRFLSSDARFIALLLYNNFFKSSKNLPCNSVMSSRLLNEKLKLFFLNYALS